MTARKPTPKSDTSKSRDAAQSRPPRRPGRPPKSESRPAPRDALLAAADDLFYQHGIQASGIDALARRARVSKASLYHEFGSKAALAHAYLAARERTFASWFQEQMQLGPDEPKGKILWVIEVVARFVRHPNFHGCAFINAATECRADPSNTFESLLRLARDHKSDLRASLAALAAQAGVSDATGLAASLALLIDGLLVSASMASNNDATEQAISAAHRAARDLLHAALARTDSPRPPAA